MKTLLTILLTLLAPFAYAAQKSTAKIDYEAAWTYSLTVTDEDGEEYFTVSLLKTGQLAYDHWVDSAPDGETSVALTDAQKSALEAKFAAAYKALPNAKDASKGATYALELIQAKQATTYTVTGSTPELKALLDAMKPILGPNYPLELK